MATKARAVASGAMLTRWGLLQCVRGAEPFLFPDLSLPPCRYLIEAPLKVRTHPCPPSPCRYLVEAPPNVCTPTHLAEAAHHIAQRFPSTMTLKVGAGSGRYDSAALSLNSLRQRMIAASCLLEDAVCEAIRTGRWPSPPPVCAGA